MVDQLVQQSQDKSMLAPGKILVAHPNLESGIFAKSVILLTEHHDSGTVGFILNNPLITLMIDLASASTTEVELEERYIGRLFNE